jgi:excisionase family DNA binding protein
VSADVLLTSQIPNQPEGFIHRKEAAQRLGVGLRTLDSWTAAGRIPYYKIGGKSVLFKWSEVEAHLRETCQRNG